MSKEIILKYFTLSEYRFYFAGRSPKELKMIADMLESMTYDERQVFRQNCAEIYGQQVQEKKP